MYSGWPSARGGVSWLFGAGRHSVSERFNTNARHRADITPLDCWPSPTYKTVGLQYKTRHELIR